MNASSSGSGPSRANNASSSRIVEQPDAPKLARIVEEQLPAIHQLKHDMRMCVGFVGGCAQRQPSGHAQVNDQRLVRDLAG